MSCFYSVNFEVEIDPQKEMLLQEKMYALGFTDEDFYFEQDEEQDSMILSIELNYNTSYFFARDAEEFFKSTLHEAARSTVLITEECDGERNTYAIGPDNKDIESQYHRDRIEWHLELLSNTDKDLVKKWVTNPS